MYESERTNAAARGRGARDIDDMPVAMAYVPWQKWETLYDKDEALKRGTVFQSLDMPFHGKEAVR